MRHEYHIGTKALALAAVLSLSFSGIAGAQLASLDLPERKGFEIYPVTVHTAFKTEVQLDTNTFLEHKDEKFDVITILNPSAGLELPVGDNMFSVDYDFKANLFGVYHDQTYFDHRVRGLAEIKWTDYTITLSDTYKYFSDRAGSEDTNRVKRQNNYMRLGVKARFDQLAFDAGYNFGLENYISDEEIYRSTDGVLTYHDKNRFINLFDLELSYRFLPKTSVLLENDFAITTYHSSDSSDSWYNETLIGVRGDLTKDFSANIKAGLRYQYYKSSGLTDHKSFLGPVVRGGATYYFTDDDIFILNLERSIYESTFQNMNYYEVNHVGLDYTHFFTRKISGNLFGYYQLNLYPSQATVDTVTAKRYDNLAGMGIELRYDIQKWLMIKAAYEYKQRWSRFSVYDYMDNLITLSGVVGF